MHSLIQPPQYFHVPFTPEQWVLKCGLPFVRFTRSSPKAAWQWATALQLLSLAARCCGHHVGCPCHAQPGLSPGTCCSSNRMLRPAYTQPFQKGTYKGPYRHLNGFGLHEILGLGLAPHKCKFLATAWKNLYGSSCSGWKISELLTVLLC